MGDDTAAALDVVLLEKMTGDKARSMVFFKCNSTGTNGIVGNTGVTEDAGDAGGAEDVDVDVEDVGCGVGDVGVVVDGVAYA